jgi:nucleoside-diphosphate-sugar epimerase
VGTLNVLEATRAYSPEAVFIFTSTNKVYGDRPNALPLVELETRYEIEPDHPYANGIREDMSIDQTLHSLFGASKVAAELLVQSSHELYDLQFTILRYGIPYGPRGREGTVIRSFVAKALRGEPLTIHGDGNQTRNFIYVEDLAAGNLAALQDAARNRIYNLGGARQLTIREVASTVAEMVGNVEVRFTDARNGDHRTGLEVTNERAARDLGWKPEIVIREGLSRYIEWYRHAVMERK